MLKTVSRVKNRETLLYRDPAVRVMHPDRLVIAGVNVFYACPVICPAVIGIGADQYEYDALGNITGITDGAGNHTEYILDKWGRIAEIRQVDGNGDRLEKYQKHGTTRYSYDSMRRLAKVEYPDATEELFYDR